MTYIKNTFVFLSVGVWGTCLWAMAPLSLDDVAVAVPHAPVKLEVDKDIEKLHTMEKALTKQVKRMSIDSESVVPTDIKENIREYVRLVVSTHSLTVFEVAESVRLSSDWVGDFIAGSNAGASSVCENLAWYLRNSSTPFSGLRAAVAAVNLPGGTSVEELERDFFETKNYLILPRKLKDQRTIEKYLTDLIGGDPSNIESIAAILHTKPELIHGFLAEKGDYSFWCVYSAIRHYYRHKTKPLSQSLAEYERPGDKEWTVDSLLSRLMCWGGNPYKLVKTQ